MPQKCMASAYFKIKTCDKNVILFIKFFEFCRLPPYKKYKTSFTSQI